MEIVELISKFFSDQDFLFKIILVILVSLYGLFALVLAIQIKNLNKIINQIDFSPVFNLLSLIHVGATIALLFGAVVFL